MARHGENIYKRKDGRYEGRYITEYDASGKAKYHAVYAKTYLEVKQKMKEAKQQHESATTTPSTITVTDWFYMYLDKIKSSIKITTHSIYMRYVENHIAPYFENKRLYKLNQELLQGFADELARNGLCARTVQAIFIFMGEGLKAANSERLVDRVWNNIRLPKPINAQMRVFTVDEQKRIETAVRGSDNSNYIGVFLCLYTGLRIGEVCGLMWKDINFRDATLQVKRTIQRIDNDGADSNKTKVAMLPPKSEASCRVIPLPAFVLDRLREYKSENGSNGGYVLHKNGNPIEPRTYQYQFQKLLKTAGVEKANFHTTRHTFATRALETGFDIKTLCELLGHASATITLNKYAHSLDEHKRNRMEQLSAVYG